MGLMSLIDNKNLEKNCQVNCLLTALEDILFCKNNNICKEIPFMEYSHNLFALDFNHYFTFSIAT